MNRHEAQNTDKETFCHIMRVLLQSSLKFVLETYFNYFCMLIAMNEVDSKHSQNSRSVINFKENSSFSASFKCPHNDDSNSDTFQGAPRPTRTLLNGS